MLGTYVEIAAAGATPHTIDQAFSAIARIHRLMSFHSADSDLARMREAAWGKPVFVAPETIAVLELCQRLWRATEGLFDVAVGASLVADGYLPSRPSFPALKFDGTTGDLELRTDGSVICHRPMLIDLGGIAKGYAVDRACDVLMTDGAKDILINAGGDLRTAAGPPVEIVIRDQQGRAVDRVLVDNGALASSDNSRSRRRLWTGRLQSPHRGRARRAVASRSVTTVLSPTCAIADALTKVAMVDSSLANRIARAHGGIVVSASNRSGV
ncbi:MAG TPA: FAD:protein FMN transferase [Novosphingobium sp.]|nr:FAD:protein FMN transferase [Novosphingobium sp.]